MVGITSWTTLLQSKVVSSLIYPICPHGVLSLLNWSGEY